MSDDAVMAARMIKPRIGLAGAQLKRLAQSGSFAVDDTTGNQMIAALEGVLETLSARWTLLQRLKDSPALGGTANGQWVSGHMVATAADEHGLLTQLEQARAEFPTYVEAIELAKKNYRTRDEATTADLTAIRHVDRS
jgi:hypothetical protein